MTTDDAQGYIALMRNSYYMKLIEELEGSSRLLEGAMRNNSRSTEDRLAAMNQWAALRTVIDLMRTEPEKIKQKLENWLRKSQENQAAYTHGRLPNQEIR